MIGILEDFKVISMVGTKHVHKMKGEKNRDLDKRMMECGLHAFC